MLQTQHTHTHTHLIVSHLDVVCEVVFSPAPVPQIRIKPAPSRERLQHVLPEVPLPHSVGGVVAAALQVLGQERVGEVQTMVWLCVFCGVLKSCVVVWCMYCLKRNRHKRVSVSERV